MSAAIIDFGARAPAARIERRRIEAGYREMLTEALEEFYRALAAGDLPPARVALAAFVAFDPPEETPLATLEWRAMQIRLLAERLADAECAPRKRS